MKVGIMQPYFLPYIGYFQLINSVDLFVVYDNIEYTKKGWINRNRILVNNSDKYISLPLKRDSDKLFVKDRYLVDNFKVEAEKLYRILFENYRKSPNFKYGINVFEKIISYPNANLFDFIFNSIKIIVEELDIDTKMIISSHIKYDESLKSEKKVIAICNSLKTDNYVNPIGGIELYSKKEFEKNGINLIFLKSETINYKQFSNDFVPWLSIIDLIMFNSKDAIKEFLNKYSLI